MKPTPEELKNRFTYHNPMTAADPAAVLSAYTQIREKGLEMATLVTALCPDSRELSTALTYLDQVIYNANAAVARNQDKVQHGEA